MTTEFRLIDREEAPAAQQQAMRDFERRLAVQQNRILTRDEAKRWWPMASLSRPIGGRVEDVTGVVSDLNEDVRELFR